VGDDVGLKIRKFFRDLFGSRLNSHLEEELLRTREDYEARILEYVQQASVYREQIAQLSAKIEKYEMVLLPMVYGGVLGPKKPMDFTEIAEDSDSWPAIQARWEKEQAKEAEEEFKQ
jgi:hypothetical protein